LFSESSRGDQLLALPSFSGVLSASCPFCCVLVFSSLFIVQYIFFCQVGGGRSAQGAMLVYLKGGWGNTMWHLVLTCLVFRMSPKQVWNQCLAAGGALLFSQCKVAWRNFLWTFKIFEVHC
jgi:hypothetical protein